MDFHMGPQSIIDDSVQDQGRIFAEAIHQTAALVTGGTTEAARAAAALCKATALPSGLKASTCERMVTQDRQLAAFISGANPHGRAAEIVAASSYRRLHTAGATPNITNPPPHIAPNLHDIRLSPDQASRKDLVCMFRSNDGTLITKPSGQVKTGSGNYIAHKLVKMATTPGYGKTGYIDSRFVNADGTPRVAPEAFTKGQAQSLEKAGVHLRGIHDLDAQADLLQNNIIKFGEDGLDPVARLNLQRLRDDIARAYQPKAMAMKAVGGGIIAAATAATVALTMQIASGGKIDITTLGEATGKAGTIGAGTSLADAGLYHLATKLGKTPDVAKIFAQTGVTWGLCLIAVAADISEEVKAAGEGGISTSDTIAGIATKSALDLLPLVLAPLGWAGIPLFIGALLGGRWVLAKVRELDRKIDRMRAGDRTILDDMEDRIIKLNSECDDVDRMFEQIMGISERVTPLPDTRCA